MARSLEQVIAEVSKQSDPQRQLILKQISGMPGEQQAQESSLAAKKDQAFGDILDGSRRRGLGFSGIPLGEQAKYSATEYAPAVANLKSSFNQRKSSLESALNEIGRNDYSSAYNIFNTDRQFEEQQRQFNEQMAASQRAAAASAGGGGGGGSIADYFQAQGGQAPGQAPQGAAPSYGRNSAGGFWFKDASGKPIGAYTYSQLAGKDYNEIIRTMVKSGDTGADKYLSARRTGAGQTYANNAKLNEQMLRRYNLW